MRKAAALFRNHVLDSIYCNQKAYIYSLSPTNKSHTRLSGVPLPPDCSFRLFASDEIPILSSLMGSDSTASAQHRLDSGDICYGVFIRNEAVNMNWVHLGPCFIRGLGYRHNALPTQAYIYNVYTFPTMRRQGIYTNALRLLAESLFANGISQITQLVTTNNNTVITTLRTLGYKRIKSVIHKRFCGLHYTKVIDVNEGTVSRYGYIRMPSDVYII